MGPVGTSACVAYSSWSMDPGPARLPDQYASALAFEKHLGDPAHPGSIFSFQRAVALDEQDAYPEDACRLVDEFKMYEYYVPDDRGGRWASTEETILLLRLIARRDVTAAVAHGKTFLGSAAVWIAGTPGQKDELAALIRQRGQIALALTERAHGADLMAIQVGAKQSPEGWILSGEKWLINNATRGKAMSLLATVSGEAERQLVVLLVNKDRLAPDSYRCLPKNLTHGIRGADISGIAFQDSLLTGDSLVGRLGGGLDVVLRLLQVTRIGCSSLSLGAADTALRATIDLALTRKLYETTMIELPYARHLIAGAFLDLLIAECVSTTASRTLHVLPHQLSVASAVTKYFVPTTIENAIRSLSVAMGARYYLRSGHWGGIFEKIVRDNSIVGLFDGSTVVNLAALVSQLASLARQWETGEAQAEAIETLFDLSRPCAPIDLQKLTLTNGGRDEVVWALKQCAFQLAYLKGRHGLDGDLHSAVIALVRGILAELKSDMTKLRAAAAGQQERHKSPEWFECAKRYSIFYAASACANFWLHNRSSLGGFAARPDWLVACLARLHVALKPLGEIKVPATATASVEREMVRLFRENMLFSLLPVPLANEPV
jgi:alkylation response protein AidB-like acyl-CoA dehydrogenase